MTSIEWLIEKFKIYLPSIHQKGLENAFEQAKEMHKQEIIDAWKDGYGGNEHNSDEYYQETFVSKGSDECQFEPITNTSSATICKHCGREKFLHKL